MRAQGTFRSRHRRGAAATELAILAPFLLLILFGIIEFGWLFMARQMVHHAASEATRMCSLVGHDCVNDGAARQEAEDLVNGILVDPLNITPLTFDGGGIASNLTADGVIQITLTVPMSELLLAGLLAHVLDPSGTEQVQFTVSMAHQAP